MNLPLFIYGTLHPDRAPETIAPAARLLKPVSRATIRGWRYELGEYPGVILSDESGIVSGEVFLLPEGPEAAGILARLDAYEDYRPEDPENSLFLRQITTASMEDGSQRQCWVYTYNASSRSIGSG